MSFRVNCLSGWRVGWAIAPAYIASAIRNIHVKVTDSASAPFQEAAVTALRSPSEYFESLRSVEYIRKLIQQAGVVAVPGCGFFHLHSSVEKLVQDVYRYIRFAFCKNDQTLTQAAKKLGEL